MAVTVFNATANAGLNAMTGDLLAKDATFDDAAENNENAQMLALFYAFLKGVRARQRRAQTSNTGTRRDRLGEIVGAHTSQVFMYIASMHEELYNEFFAAFNGVDDVADAVYGANLGDQGTGTAGGPVHG